VIIESSSLCMISLGQLHLSVDSLADVCPEAWLDREVNPDHVNEIAETLEKTPTLSKTLQAWVGIADVSKEDITSRRQILKGCRITIIGGCHRQAAYKKVIIKVRSHLSISLHRSPSFVIGVCSDIDMILISLLNLIKHFNSRHRNFV